MARLIYGAITSLDGYVADEAGRFEWAEPDETVHRFIGDLEQSVGAYLYGRRMYDVMAAWETLGDDPAHPAYIRDFARTWRAADKVVYSTTLKEPFTARTRIERAFDADAVRRMKAESTSDISIGGPTLAAHAIAAGLVDEYQVFVAPVVLGNGLRFLPDRSRIDLTLLDERRFPNGMVFIRYVAESG